MNWSKSRLRQKLIFLYFFLLPGSIRKYQDRMDEVIASMPGDMITIIRDLVDPVSWYRFAITCKVIMTRMKSFILTKVPNWLIYDESKIEARYPEFWRSVVNQMCLADWPRFPPTKFVCSVRKNKMVLQWLRIRKEIDLNGFRIIDNCTVSFTSNQRYKSRWHSCYIIKSVSEGICNCHTSMSKRIPVSDDVVMGKILGVPNFSRDSKA